MNPLTVVCCSVLRAEIEIVLREDYPEAQGIFLDSMLHMRPAELHRVMEKTLDNLPRSRACLLIYGDCHAHMREMARRPLCIRTPGINCCDLLLGREIYAEYRRRKAFFFLPEWTNRWREIFQKELGFTDPSLAREFMQENQRELVYIDTGIQPVPTETLREITVYFRMQVHVLPVSLNPLRTAIRSAVQRLEGMSAT